jgi:hypothetical protein
MTALTDLAAVLHVPEPLPSLLTGLTIDLSYTQAARVKGMASERAAVVDQTLGHLQALLRAGFLSQPFAPDPTASMTVTVPDSSHLRIIYRGGGAHVNLIHPVIRVLHSLHSTPEEGFAMLVAALGDEDAAWAVYDGVVFADCVASIAITAVQPHPSAVQITRLGSVALMDSMPFPATGPLSVDPVAEVDRLVLNAVVGEALDDAWLSLSGLGAFVPPDTKAGYELGEEEIFAFRDHTVIRNITVEQVFLFAYLHTLTAGRLPQLSLSA